MMRVLTPCLLAAALACAACSEKPQTTSRKADGKPWENSHTAFLASGYKPGDAAAWDKEIRERNLRQNEYVRISGGKP
jgi:hypothetical protein